MRFRRLGKSDLNVSVVCMGCALLAARTGSSGRADAKESADTIHTCMDLGINFFDTAEEYDRGASEELLGQVLQGRRTEAIIATKISAEHLAAKDVAPACEGSLRRLRTDCIDLYQVHLPNAHVPLEETMAAMEKLREQGKVRHIGVSNFGVSYLHELAEMQCGVVSNQLPYSLLWRAIEFEIIPLLREQEVNVLCYSPLMQGLLTGKYSSPEEVPPQRQQTRLFGAQRARAPHGQAGAERATFEAIQRVQEIAEGIDKSMADVAIAWLLAQKGVGSVIAGMRTPAQAKENVRACDLTLPADVLVELADATDNLKHFMGPNPDMWMEPSRMEKPAVAAGERRNV